VVLSEQHATRRKIRIGEIDPEWRVWGESRQVELAAGPLPARCPTTQELCTNERCDGVPCALKIAAEAKTYAWDGIFDWSKGLLDMILGKSPNSN
jgi:hypothetical protein